MAGTAVSKRSVIYEFIFDLESGKIASKEAATALKTVDKSAKSAEDAVKGLGQQFLQFTGLHQQVDKVKDAMNAMKVATAGVTSGMKLLKVALAATGIGALVVVLGSVVTYLTQTQRGMELVTKATDALSTGFNVVVDRVSRFGEGLSLIFQGKFVEGADKLKNSFKGIGEEMKKEIAASFELTDALDAVEDKERDLILVQAKRKNQIAELRLVAKDETKSITERRNALQQAINLENQILDDELAIARERARISDERTKAAEATDEELEENIRLQARVIDLNTQNKEAKRALIRELNGLNESGKSTKITFDDLTKSLKALREEQFTLNTSTAAGKAQYEELEKQAESLKKSLEGMLELKGELVEATQKEIEINQQLDLSYKETVNRNEELGVTEQALIKQDQDRIAMQETLKDATIQSSQQIFGALNELAAEGSEMQIAFATAQILANQAQAISAAIASATEAAKSTGGISLPILIPSFIGIVLSTIAQTTGLLNQARQARQQAAKFAEGEVDIHRPGETRGKDSIPAIIMPGESVIKTDRTAQYKPFLHAIQDGTLEDLIRVNYVEPALAMAALDNAKNGDKVDYSEKFYRQYLVTGEGNSIHKKSAKTLERIEKKLGKTIRKRYV